jgi:small subunit ribosomal protein S17
MARRLRGTVVSDKMERTVVVAVSSLKAHPVYRKKYKVTTKFVADNPTSTYKVGDLVEISETRPLSKTKRWVVERSLTAKELEG